MPVEAEHLYPFIAGDTEYSSFPLALGSIAVSNPGVKHSLGNDHGRAGCFLCIPRQQWVVKGRHELVLPSVEVLHRDLLHNFRVCMTPCRRDEVDDVRRNAHSVSALDSHAHALNMLLHAASFLSDCQVAADTGHKGCNKVDGVSKLLKPSSAPAVHLGVARQYSKTNHVLRHVQQNGLWVRSNA